MKKILVIHGPNLDKLGKREVDIYGTMNLDEINALLIEKGKKENIQIECFQSNYEGEIIEYIHRLLDDYHGLIINPAAFTHYSIAISDSLAMIRKPIVEVHLSNIYKREEFRQKSLMAPFCKGQITGLGYKGYLLGLDYLIDLI